MNGHSPFGGENTVRSRPDPGWLASLAATIIALVVALGVGGAAWANPASSPDPAHALGGADLVRALRAGGLTLYFRHTATDFARNDANMTRYEDCDSQRVLSAAGRQQAAAIGGHIRALGLPIGEVIASPFCRTMETGHLMFGRATPSTDVRGYAGTNAASPDYTPLAKLLATPPAAGTVRAITSHGNPFRAVAGPPHLAEGEAAVVKAVGSGWVVVARIRAEEWPALAHAVRVP